MVTSRWAHDGVCESGYTFNRLTRFPSRRNSTFPLPTSVGSCLDTLLSLQIYFWYVMLQTVLCLCNRVSFFPLACLLSCVLAFVPACFSSFLPVLFVCVPGCFHACFLPFFACFPALLLSLFIPAFVYFLLVFLLYCFLAFFLFCLNACLLAFFGSFLSACLRAGILVCLLPCVFAIFLFSFLPSLRVCFVSLLLACLFSSLSCFVLSLIIARLDVAVLFFFLLNLFVSCSVYFENLFSSTFKPLFGFAVEGFGAGAVASSAAKVVVTKQKVTAKMFQVFLLTPRSVGTRSDTLFPTFRTEQVPEPRENLLRIRPGCAASPTQTASKPCCTWFRDVVAIAHVSHRWRKQRR